MNTPTDSQLMATTSALMVLSRAYRGAADKALADYGLSQATAWPVILAGRLGDGVRQG
ncbi:MarR family transcriptional regulator, partial [Achromobacter xylosoxidans]